MKHLILIFALIAFVTGSYASNTFAAAPDVSCVDCLDNEDKNQDTNYLCQDCECHHSHVIGFIHFDNSHQLAINSLALLEPLDNLASKSHSSLYRPPIA